MSVRPRLWTLVGGRKITKEGKHVVSSPVNETRLWMMDRARRYPSDRHYVVHLHLLPPRLSVRETRRFLRSHVCVFRVHTCSPSSDNSALIVIIPPSLEWACLFSPPSSRPPDIPDIDDVHARSKTLKRYRLLSQSLVDHELTSSPAPKRNVSILVPRALMCYWLIVWSADSIARRSAVRSDPPLST